MARSAVACTSSEQGFVDAFNLSGEIAKSICVEGLCLDSYVNDVRLSSKAHGEQTLDCDLASRTGANQLNFSFLRQSAQRRVDDCQSSFIGLRARANTKICRTFLRDAEVGIPTAIGGLCRRSRRDDKARQSEISRERSSVNGTGTT